MRVLANDMKQQRSQNCPKVSVRGLPSVFLLILSKLILAKEGICGKCGVVWFENRRIKNLTTESI